MFSAVRILEVMSNITGVQLDTSLPSEQFVFTHILRSLQYLHIQLLTAYLIYLIILYIKRDIVLQFHLTLSLLGIPLLGGILQQLSFISLGNLITCVAILVHWNTLRSPLLPTKDKAVLVTGCDRGIGHALVRSLDKMGYEVFAGCLYKGCKGEEELRASCSPRVHTLQLDVTSREQIHAALDEVHSKLRHKKLWAIVNNAGICYIGNIEIMTEQDMHRIIDINFFGPLNVIRAFLPLLRSSKGRLVNVASNAGLAPVPQMGVYCASKAALASLSETLRYEMKMWGVNIATVVPSGYRTGILVYDYTETETRWWNSANKTVRDDYGRDCFTPKFKYENRDAVTSADLSPIVNKICHAISAKHPQAFYYSGLLARSLPFLYGHLPTWLGDQAMKLFADWFVFQPNALKKS